MKLLETFDRIYIDPTVLHSYIGWDGVGSTSGYGCRHCSKDNSQMPCHLIEIFIDKAWFHYTMFTSRLLLSLSVLRGMGVRTWPWCMISGTDLPPLTQFKRNKFRPDVFQRNSAGAASTSAATAAAAVAAAANYIYNCHMMAMAFSLLHAALSAPSPRNWSGPSTSPAWTVFFHWGCLVQKCGKKWQANIEENPEKYKWLQQ